MKLARDLKKVPTKLQRQTFGEVIFPPKKALPNPALLNCDWLLLIGPWHAGEVGIEGSLPERLLTHVSHF